MGVLQAQVWIEGTRPLLWHRFAPESLAAEAGRRVERTGGKGNDPEEWKRGVLATAKGQLYLEPSYIFGCLRDAGHYTRSGRGSLQRAITATLQVLSEKILVDRFIKGDGSLVTDPTAPVYLDVRMVRNPATGGRNVRYRVAAKAGWRTEFAIAGTARLSAGSRSRRC